MDNDKNKINFFYTLRFKLIALFLIPVVCIILLGIVSSNQASSGIEKYYKNATEDSINMAAEYMRFGFDNVKVASNQFVGDTTLMEYLRNQGDMMDRRDTLNSTQKAISARITSDEFIKNIYIISDTAKSIMTAQVQIEDGFYAGLSETEIGKYLIENPMKYIWSGQDDYLDEKLNTKPDDYAIRLIRPFGNLDSVLIMDIRVDTINKILADLSFESGYLGFKPCGLIIDKTNKNVKTDKASIYRSAIL